MKIKFLLFVFTVILLASCSTAYKSGQTPDDLYFSKPKNVEAIVSIDEESDDPYGDRQIRMGVRNARWRTFDDRYEYDYRYRPSNYGYVYGYYYNPYYCPYPAYTSGGKYVNPTNTTIRTTNLNTYNNTITTSTSGKAGTIKTTERRRYNNSNDELRENNRSYETRTYNPPANSGSGTGSSSSGSSSSGSSVTRPVRSR